MKNRLLHIFILDQTSSLLISSLTSRKAQPLPLNGIFFFFILSSDYTTLRCCLHLLFNSQSSRKTSSLLIIFFFFLQLSSDYTKLLHWHIFFFILQPQVKLLFSDYLLRISSNFKEKNFSKTSISTSFLLSSYPLKFFKFCKIKHICLLLHYVELSWLPEMDLEVSITFLCNLQVFFLTSSTKDLLLSL